MLQTGTAPTHRTVNFVVTLSPKRAGIVHYRVEGQVLIVTLTGQYTATERDDVFSEIRRDPTVPQGALLVIDARRDEGPNDYSTLRASVHSLVARLGPKLGPTCAFITTGSRDVQAHLFRSFAATFGLRVGLFEDEAGARAWLGAYLIAA